MYACQCGTAIRNATNAVWLGAVRESGHLGRMSNCLEVPDPPAPSSRPPPPPRPGNPPRPPLLLGNPPPLPATNSPPLQTPKSSSTSHPPRLWVPRTVLCIFLAVPPVAAVPPQHRRGITRGHAQPDNGTGAAMTLRLRGPWATRRGVPLCSAPHPTAQRQGPKPQASRASCRGHVYAAYLIRGGAGWGSPACAPCATAESHPPQPRAPLPPLVHVLHTTHASQLHVPAHHASPGPVPRPRVTGP